MSGEKRKTSKNEFNFMYCFRMLTENGWKMLYAIKKASQSQIEDYSKYLLRLLSINSDVECIINISERKEQLNLSGHYGVAFIEAKYEYEPPYDYTDLEDMAHGMELAEDNLLKIGVPFVPDYQFRGKNKPNKKRRNDALRKHLNLEEMENKYFEERAEKRKKERGQKNENNSKC